MTRDDVVRIEPLLGSHQLEGSLLKIAHRPRRRRRAAAGIGLLRELAHFGREGRPHQGLQRAGQLGDDDVAAAATNDSSAGSPAT